MKECLRVLVTLIVPVVLVGGLAGGFAFGQDVATQFQVTIDSAAHQAYGLYYPVTYVFGIPSGSSNLSSQYRYNVAGNWTTLLTKTAADNFNGVPAARFDYSNGIAYLSVPFASGLDSLYLRVVAGGSEVPMNYLGIAAYYDNRRAAVTVTLDDWDGGSGAYFDAASMILSNGHVAYTVGIVTYAGPDWSRIQRWYDTGYLEPASHTRSHTCSESEYLINGYAFQIEGSRNDILTNMALRNPYVTTFIEPCGYTDAQVRQNLVAAGYLVERGFPVPPVQNTFSSWMADGAYNRALYSIDTTAWYGNETASLLTQTNASFDAAYAAGGIYHLQDHPWYGLWYNGSYLSQHITYVSNRPDVWYVPFGGLYLYHFVPERGLVNVYAAGSTTPLPTAIITNPPPPPPPPPPPAPSLWTDTTMPQYSTAGDASAIEVGVKFRSDVAGYVTGVRFYKDAGNTGTHYGHVWSSDGTLWAEGAFTGETASGWQSVTFSAPVAIAANTTYIVSYHTDVGNYSLSRAYFNTGYYNAPLYAYGTSEVAGGNGVYRYGPNRSLPNQTWEASNYWVDVIFTTQAPSGPIATPIPVNPPAALSSLSLNPTTVTGGTTSTGTVTLIAAAPVGGIAVGLTSSNTVAATVPASVTVPSGSTSATFTVTTLAVSASTAVTITASYGGATQTAGLTVRPAAPSLWTDTTVPQYSTAGDASAIEIGLKFRSDVAGYVTGVRFYKDARNTGTHYGHVWSSDGTLWAEAAFTGETGSGWQSVTFSAPVAIAANTTYIASYHTDAGNYSLSRPYFSTGYYNAPLYGYGTSEVAGGNGVYRYGPNRSFPNQTWEASNYWVDVIFTIQTPSGPIATPIPVNPPAALSSLSLNPTTMTGGTTSTGTVTLTAAAPVGGIAVGLTSSNTAAATVPASVTVPSGSTSATFTVTTLAVSASTAVTITASYGGTTQTAGLTVTPPALSSLSLNPTTVTGGTNSTGTVMLTAAAPAGGIAVGLTSSNTAAATVPASVTVLGGSTSATFTVTTLAVSASTAVTITASYGGATQTAGLTVTLPALSSLSLNPTTVTGGTNSIGTVTLTAAAPAGGIAVALTSSNTAAATVPTSVTVPSGSTSATFTVTTLAVSASTAVTITASYGGVTRTAGLTVTPPALSSLSLNPTTVTSGTTSTGTVMLTAAAPAGGIAVGLTSSNTAAATVPASVTVPSGSASATFTVTTLAVSASTAVTITASYGGSTQTAGLTVRPPAPSLWTDTTVPQYSTAGDASAIEVGVKFRSDVAGYVTGVRFYKDARNTGTHYGHVWSSDGTLWAEAAFTGETGSGWQSVTFGAPVAIAANTTYIASYHTDAGNYSLSRPYFNTGYYNAPLYGYGTNEVAGGNGVYRYGPNRSLPNQTYEASNYWVDVIFTIQTPSGPIATPIPVNPPAALSSLSLNPTTVTGGTTSTGMVTLTAAAPAGGIVVGLMSSNTVAATVPASVTVPSGSTSAAFTVTTLAVSASTAVTITASYGGATQTAGLTVTPPALSSLSLNPTTVTGGTNSTGTVMLTGAAPVGGIAVGLTSSNTVAATVPASVTVLSGSTSATFTVTTLAVSASTAVIITASYGGVTQTAGLTVTPAPPQAPSLWTNTTVPQYSTAGDASAIEVGVKFRSEVAGYITGVRFYKGAGNTGTHYGHLWASDGTLLAEAVFTGETASGWQSVTFSAPVAIVANTTYIVSYHTDVGNYSLSRPYFNTGYYNAPLYAYGTSEVAGGNGVYRYGSNRSFPNQTWEASNYWVDVIFSTSLTPSQ